MSDDTGIDEDEICEILIKYGKEMAIEYAILQGLNEAEAEELIEAYLDGLC